MGFVSTMHDWLSIKKSISVIHYIKSTKYKYNNDIFICADNSFGKVQHPSIIENTQKNMNKRKLQYDKDKGHPKNGFC